MAKSRFLASIERDRTPMNAVVGATGCCWTKTSTRTSRTGGDGTRIGESLLALLNDILDFSKMPRGMALERIRSTFTAHDQVAVDTAVLHQERARVQTRGSAGRAASDCRRPDRAAAGDAQPVSNAVKITARGGCRQNCGWPQRGPPPARYQREYTASDRSGSNQLAVRGVQPSGLEPPPASMRHRSRLAISRRWSRRWRHHPRPAPKRVAEHLCRRMPTASGRGLRGGDAAYSRRKEK